VAIDPPAHARQAAALLALARGDRTVHLAWGEPELAFALGVLERDHALREPAAALYRALRDHDRPASGRLEAALAGADPPPSAVQAGRALRVLVELGLIRVDPASRTVEVPVAGRTSLDRSATYRRHQGILGDGRRWLSGATPRAA